MPDVLNERPDRLSALVCYQFVTTDDLSALSKIRIKEKAPIYQGFSQMGGTGLEPVTPSLSSQALR
jgi:hypothetical protein